MFERRVVVVTPECDLVGDYFARRTIEQSNVKQSDLVKSEAKVVPHIQLCEVFEESEIKELADLNSRSWNLVKTNQNVRYHRLPEAEVVGLEETNPAFVLDFMRLFSMPRQFLYMSVQCDGVERRGVIPSPWIDSLIDRLFHFHGRVCVPDQNDNRSLGNINQS